MTVWITFDLRSFCIHEPLKGPIFWAHQQMLKVIMLFWKSIAFVFVRKHECLNCSLVNDSRRRCNESNHQEFRFVDLFAAYNFSPFFRFFSFTSTRFFYCSILIWSIGLSLEECTIQLSVFFVFFRPPITRKFACSLRVWMCQEYSYMWVCVCAFAFIAVAGKMII